MTRKLFIAMTCLVTGACGPSGSDGTPEDELRAWVARGETAAEEKDRGELLDMISPVYADSRGNDRQRIGDLLRVYFLRQDAIALLTSIDDVQLMGDGAALVDVTVGMAGTRNSGLGVNADAYSFRFELEKPEDEWLLIGMQWSELGGQRH
jgi:hypothetical protein